MKPALFVSDLHLAPDRPGIAAAFHAFTRGPAREAAAVYILGDLFDAWLGDDQARRETFARTVAASLRAVSDAGVALFIACGNRDFLLGEDFARSVGATLLGEQTLVDPYFVRRLIGASLRRGSRAATARKSESILDVNRGAVEQAFRTHAVTRIIHGHTHRPARHASIVDGVARERIVLADWDERGHYTAVDANGVHDHDIDVPSQPETIQ
jgi:UDP-2,3-diacylglucosamine hydrolase